MKTSIRVLAKWISLLTYSFLTFCLVNAAVGQTPQYSNNLSTDQGNMFPFGWETGQKVQLLYLSGEFNQPTAAPSGMITSISFRMPDGDTLKYSVYSDLEIKMGQAGITTFTPGSFYQDSMTTVFNADSIMLYTNLGPWIQFNLQTPYEYDNTQSLILEISQCEIDSGSGFKVCRSILTDVRRLVSAGGCPFTIGSTFDATVLHVGLNFCTPPAAPVNTTPTQYQTACAGSNTTLYATASGPIEWYSDSMGNNLLHTGANYTTPFLYETDTFYVRTTDICHSAMTPIIVTVFDRPVVSISGFDTLLCLTDPAITLIGIPAGGTFEGNGITGNSFDPATAGIGYWDIEYDYVDINGCDNTAVAFITVENCDGLQIFDENQFDVFPNPTSGQLSVTFPAEDDYTLSFIDALGQIVQTTQISAQKTAQLDLNSVAPGVYMLKIENAEEFVLKRVVVER